MATCFMETVQLTTILQRMARCLQLVVECVPALEDYRPRLFPTVRALCSALSSQSLPQLKHKFLKQDGLPCEQFVRVVFRQLSKTHPAIMSEREAPYTVAMLQEMFFQIDYNDDKTVDWDEFTSFCIQNVQSLQRGFHETASLDQYAIEYAEDISDRDKALTTYSTISSMRQISETRRLVVVPDESDKVLLYDMEFNLKSTISANHIKASFKEPAEVNQGPPTSETKAKVTVYDAVYMSGKDMYAYCASDHGLYICKEQSSAGGRTVHFQANNRLLHSVLQIKLCWSQRTRILCSVGTDRVISGWDIDASKVPIFKVQRHEDVITDFHALDEIEMFATCSLDKRIVLWNMTTRRVKGVLLGHTRGVRNISYSSGLLLSCSFECDARVWDVSTKEVLLFLRGHRSPVAAVKLMCEKAQSDDELRAITVDDSGEFRLWDVFVHERGSEPMYAPTLQVFFMNNPEPALSRFRFIECPYNPSTSQGNYSDLIACSSKLLHFIPKKNIRDFVPPTCFVFDEFNAMLVTAVGRSLLKYDIATGHFISSFFDMYNSDLTSLAMDGKRARRIYVGCNNGHVLLVNFSTGLIIDKVTAHTAEVSCLVTLRGARHNLFTSSMDGDLMIMEETSGTLSIQRTFRKAFGNGVGVNSFFLVEALNAMFVISNSRYWGVWNTTMFKRLMIFSEKSPVSSIQIIPSTSDKRIATTKASKGPLQPRVLLTVAVACHHSIFVYVVDILDRSKALPVFELTHGFPMNVTSLTLINYTPQKLSGKPNFNAKKVEDDSKLTKLLVACTENGVIVTWDASRVRSDSKRLYRQTTSLTRQGGRRNSSVVGSRASMIRSPPQSGMQGLSPTARMGSGASFSSPIDTGSSNSLAGAFPFFTTELMNEKIPSDSSEDEETRNANRMNRSRQRLRSRSKSKKMSTGCLEDTSLLHPFDRIKSPSIKERVEAEIPEPRKEGLEIIATSTLIPEEGLDELPSRSHWKGHVDSICGVIPIQEQSCFVTASHDGFFRVWNVHSDCFGELPLPNLTDKMRSSFYKLNCAPAWKFMFDQVQVVELHKDMANRILYGEQSVDDRTRDFPSGARPRSRQRSISHDHQTLSTHGSSTKATEDDSLRMSVLKALVEPHSMPDDAPPVRLTPLGGAVEADIIHTGRSTSSSHSNHSVNDHKVPSLSIASPNMSSLATFPSSTVSHGSNSQSHLQENSVFSHMSLWTPVTDPSLSSALMLPQAFSESSLSSDGKDGLIDIEAHRILRKIASEQGRAKVYDRTASTLLLRNPSLSTSVVIPPIAEMRMAEVHFGPQKDMYKNAEKYLNERGDMSKRRARDVVTQARIKRNIHKVRTMIHLIPPLSHDEVALPPGSSLSTTDDSSLDSERMKSRLRTSAKLAEDTNRKARTLDRDKMDRLVQKVQAAEKEVPDWEKRFLESARRAHPSIERNNPLARAALEKKLYRSISWKASSEDGAAVAVKKTHLKKQELGISYKMSDITQFIEMFMAVDEDGSGEFNCEEWVSFFTSLNKSTTPQEARMMFMEMDRDNSNSITLTELIPVTFDKANAAQQKAISTYIEARVKNSSSRGKNPDGLSEVDLRRLFRCYDSSGIGFVTIGLIRERIKSLQLPVSALVQAMDYLKDMEDDEMVNQAEFVHLLEPYME